MFNAPASVRLFLLMVSINVWLGIALTGFAAAHPWLYVIGSLLLLAAATGFCPGMLISRWLVKKISPAAT
jgi:hypothetical protein